MKKNTIAILVAVAIVGGTLVFVLGSGSRSSDPTAPQNAVSIVDGMQIIDLRAKAGFQPRKVVATAGMPTVLRVTTKATFDCSSSIRIPSLNISQNLEPTGVKEINLGSPEVGVLNGSCGMGMYPFQIDFQQAEV